MTIEGITLKKEHRGQHVQVLGKTGGVIISWNQHEVLIRFPIRGGGKRTSRKLRKDAQVWTKCSMVRFEEAKVTEALLRAV